MTVIHGAALPAAEAAKVAVANHGFLVIAISMGSIIGLISSVGVIDNTARDQLVTMLFLPLPLIAALAFGLAIGGYRIPALVCLPVILAISTYARRFGPRGAIAGTLLFPGYLLAFLSHGALKLGDLDWLAAEVGVGVGCRHRRPVRLLLPPSGQGPRAHPAVICGPGPQGSRPGTRTSRKPQGTAPRTPAACTTSSSGSMRPP